MNTILVADDDEIFRAMMSRQLRGLGYAVVETDDGTDVSKLIQQHRPVATIIDIVMPETEGMGVMFELVDQTGYRSRVIAVSSNQCYLDIARGEIADAVLLKPVTIGVLSKTLMDLGVSPD